MLVQADSWERIRGLTLQGLGSEHSRRAYAKALDDFVSWWQSNPRPLTREVILVWLELLKARGLSSSTINLRLSAIRKLAREAAYSGAAPYEVVLGIEKTKGIKRLGVRLGNWLEVAQAQELLNAPDIKTFKGIRDQMILALLLGAGLRRDELSKLTLEDIQQRAGRWVIVDLKGKGGRIRTVPMPSWAKTTLDIWVEIANITKGLICLETRKGGHITTMGMTPQAIRNVVAEYGKKIGINIAPHDLRRTFAHLAFEHKAPLDQIQLTLGHASIQTTERYLGIKQNLHNAPCDKIPLELRIDG